MNRTVESVSRAIEAALATVFETHCARGRTPLRIAVALSGGRDSTTLLHALAEARTRHAIELSAIHVHHGLSPNADAWARFCEDACASLGIAMAIARVAVRAGGGQSIEDAARKARLQALLAQDVDVIALAHHADDQAETLLLQLMRGAGPHGLAAMSLERARDAAPSLLRPFIALPASAIASYAQAHALAWIDDESNADVRYRRNALRHGIVPALRAVFPGYPTTLVRAAAHQAEAAALLDEIASIDASTAGVQDPDFGLALDHHALATLAREHPARARNLLRWFIRSHDLIVPSTARLRELLGQCAHARPGSRMTLRHAGVALSLHDGRLVVHPVAETTPLSLAWHGEPALTCPGGVLTAQMTLGSGIDASVVATHSLRVRNRAGGERVRVSADGRAVPVSRLLGSRRTPLWQRGQWPLVWENEIVVAVPGIVLDPRYAARAGCAGYVLRWQPAAR